MHEDLCPLCGSAAYVEHVGAERVWRVACVRCRQFTVDEHLWEVMARARSERDRRVLDKLTRLSEEAQGAWADGGRLNLTVENWLTYTHHPTAS